MNCKHCQMPMDQDKAWRPKPGFDPVMRKYRCGRCRRVEYAARPIIIDAYAQQKQWLADCLAGDANTAE